MKTENRTVFVKFRCNDEERNILQKGADSDERNLSDFIRFHMLEKAKERIIKSQQLEMYKNTNKQLDINEKMFEMLGQLELEENKN